MNALLVLLLIVPAAGAVLCALAPARFAKSVALLASLGALGISIALAVLYFGSGVAPSVSLGDIARLHFSFKLSLDPISLWLVILTAFLQPLAVAASFTSIKDRPKEYYAWMMVLMVAMLGVFVARDALLFYVFFELTLVPMFFIIGIWGGPERRYAAAKFFLFTFTGSVFTLAAIIYLGAGAGTFDIASIVHYAQSLSPTPRFWVTLGFLAGFAVKVPLFPVHTWLPLAHTEAPTAGSVILAGVLLKLGTYGIMLFVLPIGFVGEPFPILLRVVASLCIIGIIYGALVAWVQQDIKKLVAYSSVSHLGFCVLGLAALNAEGVQGSILYMINHGLSTGAMFLVIGMIYERHHTRDINQLSGLARTMPVMSFFFILFVLSSIGLPGLNGFVSEFLTVLGAFRSRHLGMAYGTWAALGIVLGAVYMLHMAARVIFGPVKTPEPNEHEHPKGALPQDLTPREIGILVPIAIMVVVLGVIPASFLRTTESAVQQMLQPVFSPSPGTPGEGRGEGPVTMRIEPHP